MTLSIKLQEPHGKGTSMKMKTVKLTHLDTLWNYLFLKELCNNTKIFFVGLKYTLQSLVF